MPRRHRPATFLLRAAASTPSSSTSRWTRPTSCSSAAARSSASKGNHPPPLRQDPHRLQHRSRSRPREESASLRPFAGHRGRHDESGMRSPSSSAACPSSPLMPSSVDAPINIPTEPKNAIVRQYQQLFGPEGAAHFTDGCCALAEKGSVTRAPRLPRRHGRVDDRSDVSAPGS